MHGVNAMTRRPVYLVLVALMVGGIIGGFVGVFLFINLVGGSGEPSVTISAPTLALNDVRTEVVSTSAPDVDTVQMATNVAQIATQLQQLSTTAADDELAGQVAQVNTQVTSLLTLEANRAAGSTVVQAARPTRTPQPTFTPSLTPTPTTTPTPFAAAQANQRLFRIVPEESEARYIVDELDPFITGLVGRTNQVAGDLIVDFNNPANSRVGTIRINLRTLRTGEPARDDTVRGMVLLSARPEYEFADFVPTAITGLPDSITFGEPITFQITGDFPIRGITHALTFAVTVTAVSETELHGLGTTTIQRSDYDLLQSALASHGVSEEVRLEIEFVARAVEE
jgi:polyisoprenoid-binding protein YceI